MARSVAYSWTSTRILLTTSSTDSEAHKRLFLELWAAWRDVWVLLSTPMPGETPNTKPCQQDRERRAEEYQRLADIIMSAFWSVAGRSANMSIYMHVVQRHVATYIREYGNLSHYNSEGAEHMHVFVKYACRWLSNKRANEHVVQTFNWVTKYLFHRKNWLQAHSVYLCVQCNYHR